jgi:hypothetical protein
MATLVGAIVDRAWAFGLLRVLQVVAMSCALYDSTFSTVKERASVSFGFFFRIPLVIPALIVNRRSGLQYR